MNSNKGIDLQAEMAFTAQSSVFDELYGQDPMIAYKRSRVREHMMKYLQPASKMLELNCGTGEDAIYFAGLGHVVHASDVSEGMLAQVSKKISDGSGSRRLTMERCSFADLNSLHHRGPYDYLYSNFGGLNCTGELGTVLDDMITLVKPGGHITLVIISKFCLWETILLFRGKFRTAFRRFFSGRGRSARVENRLFKCWYYSPSFVSKRLAKDFDTVALEGLCSIVPPSYIQGFSLKYPKAFAFLSRQEAFNKSRYPWKYIGDYFIITLRKKQPTSQKSYSQI